MGSAAAVLEIRERGRAWLLLLANIGLILVTVYVTVLFNQWYNAFYNALQAKAQAGVLSPARAFLRARGDLHPDCGLPHLFKSNAADPLASLADRSVFERLAPR